MINLSALTAWFKTAVPDLTSDKVGALRMTKQHGLHVNLRDDAGNELGTVANPLNTTGGGGGGGGSVTQGTVPWVVSGAVSVSNLPATQPVSIASMPSTPVTGTFFQATQPVSGTFFQSTQPVSGTFWQTTQPVSGTLAISNFPATQPVSGTVAVSNFPATQPVSIASMPSTPVTGTFFQATQPVSGTVAVNNFPATQPVSGAVAVSNFPATQPISGSVSVTSVPTTPVTNSSLDANLSTLMTQPIVSDAPQTYIDATTQPLSLTSDGRLRVASVTADIQRVWSSTFDSPWPASSAWAMENPYV